MWFTIGPPILLGVIIHQVYRRKEPEMTVLSAMVGGLVPLLAGVIRAFLMGRLGWEFKFSGLDYIIYIISLVSSILIYRLSPFHPLFDFPGPWILRVTKF